MTKMVREAGHFTVRTRKAEGIGTTEFDFIHLAHHRPGIAQAAIRGGTEDRQVAGGCKVFRIFAILWLKNRARQR